MKPSTTGRLLTRTAPPEPTLGSSQGHRLGCPVCGREPVLVDLKDGDQGYWCMSCERGWRVGHLPAAAFKVRERKKELEAV